MGKHESYDRDWLWWLSKNAWSLAAAVGTVIMVLASVGMQVYAWFMDQPILLNKALIGLAWASGYFIIALILRAIKKSTED